MMKDNYTNPISQWIVAALFFILTLTALYFFVFAATPKELRKPTVKFAGGYKEDTLLSALNENNLKASLAQIKTASLDPKTGMLSRVSGTAGCANTEALVTHTFQDAGMTVSTQRFSVVVPVTEYCEVLDEKSQPLPGVKLLPFEPAGLLPTALPAAGVAGDLISLQTTTPLDMVKIPVEGSIVLVNGLTTPADWTTLAAMGARAVMVKEDPAATQAVDAPAKWDSVATPYDIKYPRFYVTGPIEQYAHKKLRIRCKVSWKTKEAHNIIGVLPGQHADGENSTKEALVLTSYYDSWSMVPDLAPGGEQAMPLAVMLNMAKAMASYKGQMKRDVVFIAMGGHCQAIEGVSHLLEAIDQAKPKAEGDAVWQKRIDEHQHKLEYIKYAREILQSEDPWKTSENSAYANTWNTTHDKDFRQWFERCFAVVAGEVNLQRKEEYLIARVAWIRGGRHTFRPEYESMQLTAEQRSDPKYRDPLMQAYLDAKKLETQAGDQVSVPFWTIAHQLYIASDNQSDNFKVWKYREMMTDYLNRLEAYHSAQRDICQDSLNVRRLFAGYDTTMTLNIETYSGGATAQKDLAILVGRGSPGTVVEPQSTDLRTAMLENTPVVGTDPIFKVSSWGTRDFTGAQADLPNVFPGGARLESGAWFLRAHVAFTIANRSYNPIKLGTPADTFESLQTKVVGDQLPVIGKTLLQIAFGNIKFKTMGLNSYYVGDMARDCYGTVYTTASSSSVVPNHPVGINTFVHVHQLNGSDVLASPRMVDVRGMQAYPIWQANPYGEYEHHITFNLGNWVPIFIDAARFNDDGTLAYYDDTSSSSQTIFASQNVQAGDILYGQSKAENVAVFRGTMVECYQRVNPKTLNAFAKFDFMSYPGFDEPTKNHIDNNPKSPAATAFLEPDSTFAIALLDGSAQNPDIQTYRAFMLNVARPPFTQQITQEPAPDHSRTIEVRHYNWNEPITKDEPELYGQGYLAADVSDPDPDNKYVHLTMPYFDAAATMLRTNEKRLTLQNQYHMADDQMNSSHENAKELLYSAWQSRNQGDTMSAMNDSGRSLAYAINNHPVIRDKISNAVLGILWYLMLLVPFVFFFEKLMFGFTDIRKQLLAHGVVFITVFFMLQAFHPAFKMVRSSLMILLGFLIFLLSVVVTLMVTGRFQSTIKSLRRKEGYVEGADVNRSGVIGTAFMLGLNNMRRRKVRTGLTCVTLTLITFVMICFTSVTTSMQNKESMTGRSIANGILRRDPNFIALTDNELNNIKQIYGLKYPVAVTAWVTGVLNPFIPLKNPEFAVSYTKRAGVPPKSAKVFSAMTMSWNEPLFSGLDKYLLTKKGWFPHPPETPQETAEATKKGLKLPLPDYIILPKAVADSVELTEAEVNTGHPTITLGATQYEVWGIIDEGKLKQHVGMDGQSILPYDLNTVQSVAASSDGKSFVVPSTIGRMPAEKVVITSKAPAFDANTQQNINVSCSILFPSTAYRLRSDQPELPAVTYKEQRKLVDEYLERIGIGAYYSVAGVSYYGIVDRTKSVTGLVELLIPLLIAALTVFNTMRSSVYERKDDIYVYNAVGIAPNHIFFMFMAEACVYAVIGAMAGYLLSQISMTILTTTPLAPYVKGLNMDYSSIETIYASLAIVASVLLSTLVPARTASRLALPTDEASWTVPKPDGDIMHFNLPFTFGAHDRVAVISYFYRWLDANGEGSSGPFYCAPPKVLVDNGETEKNGGVVPAIETTVWLKPYDLGVSQRLHIALPTDPETGEFIASITIERLSGTMSAWNRAVMPFLGSLRKQFLNWRAVSNSERAEMFEEARTLFTTMTNQDRETANV